MVIFPNCKINLGLRVVARRPDGYHDLETIFYPLPLKDALEIVPLPATGRETPPLQFTATGLDIPGDEKNNLCRKAWELIRKDHPGLPPLQMHLHKAIPMGAGLGGGSSDGAHTLLLLDQLFQLGMSEAQLKVYALALGSDCPFFLVNRPSLAKGRGERLTRLPLDLKGYHIVLVHSAVHVSTAWAFSMIRPAPAPASLEAIAAQPVRNWRHTLVNDFEAPVFERYPELAATRQKLYDAGAEYAAMTGTGSTLFGLFVQKPAALASALGDHRLMIL